MMDLKGKTALVTGASSGIGDAVAHELSAAGARVILIARRKDRLEALAATIQGKGGDAVPYQADVTSEEEVVRLFKSTRERYGQIDILVNNAGISDSTPTNEMTLRRWKDVLDINLTSVFLCSREAFGIMKDQKRGRIINVGSISAKSPRPDTIAYTTTKAALVGLTHSLALDGRQHGITASIVHPGVTATEIVPGIGDRPAAECMMPQTVARMITTIASMPDETLVFETVILPIAQPFIGRG
jgi:NAD(P)-dependent dehydrogenase (short-subunit alcohol dehydrogenase family)